MHGAVQHVVTRDSLLQLRLALDLGVEFSPEKQRNISSTRSPTTSTMAPVNAL